MRSIVAVMASLLLAAGIAFAQQEPADQGGQQDQQGQSQGGQQQEMTDAKTVMATVDEVNKDQKRITVTSSTGEKMEYVLSNDTMIVGMDGQVKTIGDLKAGSMVSITYTGSGENAKVQKVEMQKGQ